MLEHDESYLDCLSSAEEVCEPELEEVCEPELEEHHHVGFTWVAGGQEIDPNDMDTKHICNSITYLKRKRLEGGADVDDLDEKIAGFRGILEVRGITRINEKAKEGLQAYPYHPVDFIWFAGGEALDPNELESSHIRNTLTYLKRKRAEVDVDRIDEQIAGFRGILETRGETVSEGSRTNYQSIAEGMGDPVLVLTDKETGDMYELGTTGTNLIDKLAIFGNK